MLVQGAHLSSYCLFYQKVGLLPFLRAQDFYLKGKICTTNMSMMYAHQAVAFEALRQYDPVETNSTPDSPPSRPVDLKLACAKKQEIVYNLPTQCAHCSNPIAPPLCFKERPNGDIFAYCLLEGGCNKSSILYKAPTSFEVFGFFLVESYS